MKKISLKLTFIAYVNILVVCVYYMILEPTTTWHTWVVGFIILREFFAFLGIVDITSGAIDTPVLTNTVLNSRKKETDDIICAKWTLIVSILMWIVILTRDFQRYKK